MEICSADTRLFHFQGTELMTKKITPWSWERKEQHLKAKKLTVDQKIWFANQIVRATLHRKKCLKK